MPAAYLGARPADRVRHVAPPDAKAIATLKARFALLGFALEVTEDDAGAPLFVVSRWSLTRQLRSVDEVDAFLARAAGPGRGN